MALGAAASEEVHLRLRDGNLKLFDRKHPNPPAPTGPSPA